MQRPVLATTLALLAVAAEARAQSADDLVRAAVELRRVGRDADALAALERAWRVAPSPRVRAQMGFAEQALDRWVEADAHLREALAAPDAWVTERRAIVEDALRAVEQRVASFDVRCATPGATLWIDGRPVGALPLAAPLRLRAGHVGYEVRASGHEAARRESVLPAATITRDEVVLTPLGGVGYGWGPRHSWALVSTVGAALGIGVGVVTFVSQPNISDDRSATRTALAVSATSFVVGGALAVTAAVLWITAPSPRRERALLCAPDVAARGVACALRF